MIILLIVLYFPDGRRLNNPRSGTRGSNLRLLLTSANRAYYAYGIGEIIGAI